MAHFELLTISFSTPQKYRSLKAKCVTFIKIKSDICQQIPGKKGLLLGFRRPEKSNLSVGLRLSKSEVGFFIARCFCFFCRKEFRRNLPGEMPEYPKKKQTLIFFTNKIIVYACLS